MLFIVIVIRLLSSSSSLSSVAEKRLVDLIFAGNDGDYDDNDEYVDDDDDDAADDDDDDNDDDDDDAQERRGKWSIEFLADNLPQGEVEREQVVFIAMISSDFCERDNVSGGPCDGVPRRSYLRSFRLLLQSQRLHLDLSPGSPGFSLSGAPLVHVLLPLWTRYCWVKPGFSPAFSLLVMILLGLKLS